MKTPILPLISTYLKTLMSSKRFSSREALECWQEKQVRGHLQWLSHYSPYYHRQLEKVDTTLWRDLPLMTKKKMMSNFDQLNTAHLKKQTLLDFAISNEKNRHFNQEMGGFTVGLSSGTSGNRGLFIVSQKERARWAGYILAKMLPRALWNKQRIALFLRSGGPLYQSTNGRRINFSYYDLFQELDYHINQLQEDQPTVLVGPPSVLRSLAKYQSTGKLSIKPEKIISVAEVLDPFDRTYIEGIFDSPLHQIYQATEGCIASTCSHGTLHLHEDLLLVEKEFIEGSSRRFIPIITDFSRTTQPIIRYRLDDILIEKKTPCPCGSIFTALDSIEGRCDDVLLLERKNGHRKITIYPDFIRQEIASSSPSITEFKVIQTSLSQIQIEFSCQEDNRPSIERLIYHALDQFFNSQGARTPHIFFHQWQPKPLHQKLRRIQRDF